MGLPTCAFMHGRPPDQPERMRKNFASFVREYAFSKQSSIFVVTDWEDRFVGQIWLNFTNNRFNGLNELWVWDLTVSSEFRGRGIGRALFNFALDQAAQRRASELWLLVSSKNPTAIGLYRSVGLTDRGHFMAIEVPHQPRVKPTQIEFGMATIRPLVPADIPGLFELWTIAGLGFKKNGRDHEDRLASHLGGPSIGGWGATQEGKLIASAIISSDGRKGWIERVATRPEARRTGLARALIAAAKQTLLEDGNLVIGALIEHSNTASRALFEAAGFVIDDHHFYYSYREDPDA